MTITLILLICCRVTVKNDILKTWNHVSMEQMLMSTFLRCSLSSILAQKHVSWKTCLLHYFQGIQYLQYLIMHLCLRTHGCAIFIKLSLSQILDHEPVSQKTLLLCLVVYINFVSKAFGIRQKSRHDRIHGMKLFYIFATYTG